MAFDNTNRGVLFNNDRKTTDKHPDRTGSINVEGVDYFLDAWIKEKDGKKFLSISVKRKNKQSQQQGEGDQQQERRPAPSKPKPPAGNDTDEPDIPWT